MVHVANMSSKYVVLPDAEIKALARRARSGDIEARNTLILHNLRLVARWSRSFMRRDFFEDVFADGILGLMHAVEKYDPDLGYKFSTYATFWIQLAVQRSIYKQNKLHLSIHNYEHIQTIKNILSRENLSPEQLAMRTNLDLELVKFLLSFMHLIYPSFDREHHESEDDGITLAASIPDKYSDDYDEVEDHIDNTLFVRHLFTELTENEQQVLTLFYGLDGQEPMDIKQIAVLRKSSRQAVTDIHRRALTKLRTAHPELLTPAMQAKVERTKMKESVAV